MTTLRPRILTFATIHPLDMSRTNKSSNKHKASSSSSKAFKPKKTTPFRPPLTPEEKKERKQQNLLMAGLGFLSAVLLSIPYLVPHTGILSLFAFVPLLMMERIGTLSERRHMFWWYYCPLLLWNFITTFWVCNATVGGGIFASVANALQMAAVFAVFRVSRKAFKGALPYIFLAVAWIAWEKAYFNVDISWPWLTLGNSFARTLSLAQWYEFTGTLGGSLWIWTCNLALFGVICSLSDGSFFTRWTPLAKILSVCSLILLPLVPSIISIGMQKKVRAELSQSTDKLEVLILQPNFDPYQKFQSLSQAQQNAVLLGLIKDAIPDRMVPPTDSVLYQQMLSRPLLAVAPETFTGDVNIDDIENSKTVRSFTSFLKNYPGVNLLFGATTREMIHSEKRPSDTVYDLGQDNWLQSRNSALIIDGSGRNEIYHKSRLVVGVEMTPYPKIFRPLDDLLGGVMGREIGQEEVSLLNVKAKDLDPVPLGCAICYESVYGDYCRGYIEKGARALTVITNDAWWKDTPGYRQHLSYASLRAIETRRDIARSANTGISAIIDRSGDIHDRTQWWKSATVRGTINLNDEETFFVRNGDIVGRLCTLMAVLLFFGMCVRLIVPTARRN